MLLVWQLKEDMYSYIDNEGKVKFMIIQCDEDECSKPTEFAGYTENFDMKKKTLYPLIECKSQDDCFMKRVDEIANGYYLNDRKKGGGILDIKDFVICTEGICTTKAIAEMNNTSNCELEDRDKVITVGDLQNSFTFKFCKNVDGDDPETIDLPLPGDDPKYYYVMDTFDPDSHFFYPKYFLGVGGVVPRKRGILFKTEAYSVTALNREYIPIGYVKTENNGYMECQFRDFGERACSIVDTTANESCDAVGEVFTDAEMVQYLCVDPSSDSKIQLSVPVEEGKYMIPLAKGMFGIDGNTENMEYYIMINVDSSGNVTVVKGNDNKRKKE